MEDSIKIETNQMKPSFLRNSWLFGGAKFLSLLLLIIFSQTLVWSYSHKNAVENTFNSSLKSRPGDELSKECNFYRRTAGKCFAESKIKSSGKKAV